MNLKQHRLSAAFPAMPDDDFALLCEDIKANGLREPITIFESMVIDGWNRFRACTAVGVTPASALLPADVDPVAFVKSKNLHRRHMNASQRALAVVECSAWATVGANQHGGSVGMTDPPLTSAQMAAEADVSVSTVDRAKRVAAKATDEVKAAVKAGKVNIQTAAETTVKKPAKKAPKPAKAKEQTAAELEQQDAHGDFDPIAELERLQAELIAAQAVIKAAEADDLKAEAIKWRRAYDAAQRTASEKMDAAAKFQTELQRTSDRLVRIGKLFGERDPSKVPALVEAFYRKHTEVAACK